jgi:uncharacterized membrane protein YcjF (UPF0283 family)
VSASFISTVNIFMGENHLQNHQWLYCLHALTLATLGIVTQIGLVLQISKKILLLAKNELRREQAQGLKQSWQAKKAGGLTRQLGQVNRCGRFNSQQRILAGPLRPLP